jgi:hypothetical protein
MSGRNVAVGWCLMATFALGVEAQPGVRLAGVGFGAGYAYGYPFGWGFLLLMSRGGSAVMRLIIGHLLVK